MHTFLNGSRRNAWHRLLAVFGMMLNGCSVAPKAVDVAGLTPPYTIIVHEKGGQVDERQIDAGSEEAELIQKWLESNKSGWTPTLVTHAPNHLLNGDSFSLNFGTNICVVQDNNGQFVKHADTSSLINVFALPAK